MPACCLKLNWDQLFFNNVLGPVFKMFSWSQMSSPKSKDLYMRVRCMLRISQSIHLLNLHPSLSRLEIWVPNLYLRKWQSEDLLDSGILYTKVFTLTSMYHLNSPHPLAIKSSKRGMYIDDYIFISIVVNLLCKATSYMQIVQSLPKTVCLHARQSNRSTQNSIQKRRGLWWVIFSTQKLKSHYSEALSTK